MQPTSFISEDLLNLPRQLSNVTTTTYHWLRTDSLEAALGIGAAVVLYLLFVGIRELVCRWLGDTHDIASWRGFARRMVGRTRSFFLAAVAADLVVNAIAPPGALLRVMTFLFTVAAAFQGAIWVR
jgi:hypothetical protein